jgi:hypothetical protein
VPSGAWKTVVSSRAVVSSKAVVSSPYAVVSSVVLVAWVLPWVAYVDPSLPGPETNSIWSAKTLRATTAQNRTSIVTAKLMRDMHPPFLHALRTRC